MDTSEMVVMEPASPTVQNPFGATVRAGSGSVADTAAASREIADVQALVYLAKQYPRNPVVASDRLLTACQRVTLASVATYVYQKGGTNISGPSIRLAEEIARNWGNIDYGWQEVERLRASSRVKAYAWDMETNLRRTITFEVPHIRYTKNGSYPLKDDRDLYECVANNASRRVRACILAVIPSDVVDAATNQCQRTLVTSCEITPERIRKMVDEFGKLGVTRPQIESRIQRSLEAIQPAQFVNLMGIYTSLKDGMSEVSQWFDVETPSTATATATEKLRAKLSPKPEKKATSESENRSDATEAR